MIRAVFVTCIAIVLSLSAMHHVQADEKGLEDVAAIFFSAYNRDLDWPYDGKTEHKRETINDVSRDVLLFGKSEVEPIWGDYSSITAELKSYVISNDDCIIFAGQYPVITDKIIQNVYERFNPTHDKSHLPTKDQIAEAYKDAGERITIFLNRIFANEVSKELSLVNNRVGYKYRFKGSEDIFCRINRRYGVEKDGMKPVSVTLERCEKQFTTWVTKDNEPRFEAMLKTVYSQYCTGAVRPTGKF